MRPAAAAFLCLIGLMPAPEAGASLFPHSSFSDNAAGTTAAAFLRLPVGARAQALGGSYAAAADGSESIFWNPAGLARMEDAKLSEASLSYNALLETSYNSSVAYAYPLAGIGVLSASVVYFSQSVIQGYDTRGNQAGSFTPNDLAFSLGYAKKLDWLLLGGAVKVIHSELADASGTDFALDLGVQAQRVTDIGEGALDLGASLQNFGPPMRMGSLSNPLPFNFTGGALWHINPRVNGLVDGHLPVDQSPYASLGVEILMPVVESVRTAFRAGYNARNTRDISGFTGMTAGFGVDLYRFKIDYAWVPFGDLGDTHRISLAYRF